MSIVCADQKMKQYLNIQDSKVVIVQLVACLSSQSLDLMCNVCCFVLGSREAFDTDGNAGQFFGEEVALNATCILADDTHSSSQDGPRASVILFKEDLSCWEVLDHVLDAFALCCSKGCSIISQKANDKCLL